jgi:four helix bundle protein
MTRKFPKEEIYGLTSQIRRAAISVPANIAEGRSRNHRREFAQFLGISKGSVSEIQTFICLSEDLGYVKRNQTVDLLRETEEVEKMLTKLINTLTAST